MTTPGWLLDIFAAIMLVVAGVSAARAAAARPWQRGAARGDTDIDVAHLLMGIAMAGMLTASLTTLPDGAWEAVFAVTTVWFAVRLAQDVRGRGAGALGSGHYAPHLLHSAAMVYMFAAVAAPAAAGGTPAMAGMGGAGSGMSTLRFPTIALAFALLLAGYTVRDLDQLAAGAQRPRAAWAGLQLSAAGPAGVPALAGSGEPSGALAAGPAIARMPSSSHAAPDGKPAVPVRPADPLLSAQAGPGRARARILAPDVALGCRIAMGVTMALMLVLMI